MACGANGQLLLYALEVSGFARAVGGRVLEYLSQLEDSERYNKLIDTMTYLE